MGSRNNIIISELALRGELEEDFTPVSLGDGNKDHLYVLVLALLMTVTMFMQ